MLLEMTASRLRELKQQGLRQFSIRCSLGTAERIEEFRRAKGLRSRNEAIAELIQRGFVAADF